MVLTTGAETSPGDGVPRIHAFDWLRALAVLAIFFAHVSHIFDFDPEAAIKNDETSLVASVYMFFVLQWAVALLFLLAGVGNWFSLRTRSGQAYVRERMHRLLIPLLFGTVVLVPWIGYMSAVNHATYEGSFWRYLPVHVERTWESLKTPHIHHGPVLLYHTSWHLWFLGYLLIYALVSQPWMRRTTQVDWLAALVDRRFGLLALALPVAVLKMALTASFPAYVDWSDTLVFLTFFVYGWLFMTDPRFLRAVERQALVWLTVALASFALLLATHALGYMPRWLAHPSYAPDFLLFQLLLALDTWAWMLAAIGCGLRWLNVEGPVLRYVADATLPFYILHQVAVATAGTIVVEWSASVATKAIVIASLAFAATVATYELIVRRHRVTRVLFGLKAPRLPSIGVARGPASLTRERNFT